MDREPITRRAAFLDRDGTIIEERGDLGDPDGVALMPGAADAVRKLKDAGLAVVLVTNQSGIARGVFTQQQFEATQERVLELLGAADAHLDDVFYCPHHPDVTGPCDCRKPASGMYRRAAERLSIDLARSFYIGDRWRDVAVTEEVGGTPFLLATGAGGQGAPDGFERTKDLAEAADIIVASLDGKGG
ncbi:MAG: HAD-IIIA family hydrolase [Gemmatimonadetes bacterium]|nr:HAD-IIIA family hydrolase [Gemmatimonadota bacterium]NIO30675.1 HAD-IIIA family hydrolase [Gemmatimonadota bacterium]